MNGGGFQPTPWHPVLTMPTPEQALAMGAERWMDAMLKREKTIRDEEQQPLWGCFEPPIWRVVDALWGAPWLDVAEAERIRQNLGFSHSVRIVMLLGGWGSSKTEYAANRMSRLMQLRTEADGGIFWFLHETVPSAVDQQHPIVYKYLPPQLKTEKAIMEKVTYIAYKAKTGFSDGSFVLPNGVKGRFWTYEGGVDKLQGPTVNGAWGDELMPPEFVHSVGSRVSRAGAGAVFFITFAPIHGYTPTVQEMCDGAQVCREITSFLHPADGGSRDVGRYLGLTDAEFEEFRRWKKREEKPPFPCVPASRPEDCSKWLTGEPSQPAVPEGRKFKKLPRVLKPLDPEENRAVVLFNGADNPFGDPYSVFALNANVSEELAGRYFFGFTSKGLARKFPKFERAVHTIDDAAVPAFGANHLFIDPCDGRNFFMTWARVTPKAVFIYREWPGDYEIPDVGVPGPWALPSGKYGDGAPGPGQEGFGFGLIDYKAEIARLERWKDALEPTDPKAAPEAKSDRVKKWFAENGAAEVVMRRFLDSRFASTPHVQEDRPVTMLENFADIGLHFEPTPGDDIAEGVQAINDLLSYDPAKPIDALNCPRFFVAKSCKNTIFALETWRGKEGRKGATKDPIDNLRYLVLSGVAAYTPPEAFESEGGGHY